MKARATETFSKGDRKTFGQKGENERRTLSQYLHVGIVVLNIFIISRVSTYLLGPRWITQDPLRQPVCVAYCTIVPV